MSTAYIYIYGADPTWWVPYYPKFSFFVKLQPVSLPSAPLPCSTTKQELLNGHHLAQVQNKGKQGPCTTTMTTMIIDRGGDVHSAASNTLCALQRQPGRTGEPPLWFSIVRPSLTLRGSRKREIGAHISHQRKLSRKVAQNPAIERAFTPDRSHM